MVLLIDNYDSFTWNLAQYLGELGAPPLVRRNDEISLDEIAAMGPERIVISPGPGRPEAAGISVEVIRRFGPQTPILGVCLGHQAIGYAFGGEIVRAPQLMHGKVSAVTHDGRGLFKGISQQFPAGRRARHGAQQILRRYDARLLDGLRKQRVARREVRIEAAVGEACVPHHIGDADSLVAVLTDGARRGTHNALTRLLLLGTCFDFFHMTNIILFFIVFAKGARGKS